MADTTSRATPAAAPPTSIARPLLAWYDRARRDLPWRRAPSPYRTLVSEFMLQQTVVATVIPHFERFTARWPELPALAAASEDEVLAAWSGLGYYARARNLHRAARAVATAHGGLLPDDEEALRALPGIGPYTAAAVAAIAFGRRTFALDGNAARVVARLAGETAPIARPAVRERLRAIGQAWVPVQRTGDFAQAVMELGATVCTPRSPSCSACPLARGCVAHARGLAAVIPAKAARPEKRRLRLAAVRLRAGERVLLVRGATGLLAGTWMLPATELAAEAPSADAAAKAARTVATEAARGEGVAVNLHTLRGAGQVRHIFTHRDATVDVFDVDVTPGREKRGSERQGGPSHIWAARDGYKDLALSTFVRKQLDLASPGR